MLRVLGLFGVVGCHFKAHPGPESHEDTNGGSARRDGEVAHLLLGHRNRDIEHIQRFAGEIGGSGEDHAQGKQRQDQDFKNECDAEHLR